MLGHQVKAVDPDTGATTSTYDDAGDVLTSTDARGVTLAYSYDLLSRKTGQYQGSADSKGSLFASWTYDTVVKGQLLSSTSYTDSTAGHPGLAYSDAGTGDSDAYMSYMNSLGVVCAHGNDYRSQCLWRVRLAT
ncbi:MAG TPA: RHS repeat domain-containing protein [Microbacteriaceae bacterium]